MKAFFAIVGFALLVILIVGLIIGWIVFVPLAIIWAGNQLGIWTLEYSFLNWLAVEVVWVVLNAIFGSKVRVGKD